MRSTVGATPLARCISMASACATVARSLGKTGGMWPRSGKPLVIMLTRVTSGSIASISCCVTRSAKPIPVALSWLVGVRRRDGGGPASGAGRVWAVCYRYGRLSLAAACWRLRLGVHPRELVEVRARQRRVIHDHQVLVVVALRAAGEVVGSRDHRALVDHDHFVVQ